MNIRDFLPKDFKTVVRLLIGLVILRVVINATVGYLPPSVQKFAPNLG